MSDLVLNNRIAEKQQESGYQNNPNSNAVIARIQSSNTNRELFSDFFVKNKNQNTTNNSKNKQILKNVLTISGGVALLIGGLSYLFGRKNLVHLRAKLSKSMQDLKENKHLKKLDSVKLAAVKIFSDIIGCIFTFDIVKNFSILKGVEVLGKPGKMLIGASKGSLLLTENISLLGLYTSFKQSANSAGKSVKKALTMPKNFSNEQEQQLAERLNVLLNGNKESKGFTEFADDLIKGMKERTGKLKNTIQKENIGEYRKKYYPTALKWSEFKRAAKNWKESLFSTTSNKDVLRENWKTTEEVLVKNIKDTGANNGQVKNFGHAMEQMGSITTEMEELCAKPGCSNQFKELAAQAKSLNQNINNPQSIVNPITFETSGEKYAGRVLDLAAGGGMSEMLIPPIAGGIIAYKTLKDTKPEERKEKFIKNGGPELIGGLTAWMIVSNLLAVSGAPGMLAGLATAGILNIFSKNYLKNLQKNKTQNIA